MLNRQKYLTWNEIYQCPYTKEDNDKIPIFDRPSPWEEATKQGKMWYYYLKDTVIRHRMRGTHIPIENVMIESTPLENPGSLLLEDEDE